MNRRLLLPKKVAGASTLLNNLIAYYKLEEASGSVLDETVNANHGTNYGANTQATGKLGYCYDLDTGDYVRLPAMVGTEEVVTISLWAYFSQDYVGGIFGNYRYSNSEFFSVEQTATNLRVLLGKDGGYTNLSVSKPSTGWHHIVLLLDNSKEVYAYPRVLAYLDGTYLGVAPGASYWTYYNTWGTLIFLGKDYIGNNEFNDKIDCVKVWDRLLTTAEISEDYNSGNGLDLIL